MKHRSLTSQRALAQTLLWRYKARAAKQEMLFAKYELEHLLRTWAGRDLIVPARKRLAALRKVAEQLGAKAKEVRLRNRDHI